MIIRWCLVLFLCGLPWSALAEEGVASWYGPGFYGRHTACGQVLARSSFWLAHKSLPCGTLVRVLNLHTGRSIMARVLDRGPYVRGRIVDLTWPAARALGTTGLTRVRVEKAQ